MVKFPTVISEANSAFRLVRFARLTSRTALIGPFGGGTANYAATNVKQSLVSRFPLIIFPSEWQFLKMIRTLPILSERRWATNSEAQNGGGLRCLCMQISGFNSSQTLSWNCLSSGKMIVIYFQELIFFFANNRDTYLSIVVRTREKETCQVHILIINLSWSIKKKKKNRLKKIYWYNKQLNVVWNVIRKNLLVIKL